MGWWAISGEDLLDMLRRAANGENPDLIYAEAYANARHGQRLAAVREAMSCSDSTASKWIAEARSRGLLTGGGRGRSGGELTGRARKGLAASDPWSR